MTAALASASSPIIIAPIKWQGGAEFFTVTAGLDRLYAVPAGRNLLLIDLVVTNIEGTAVSFVVFLELKRSLRER